MALTSVVGNDCDWHQLQRLRPTKSTLTIDPVLQIADRRSVRTPRPGNGYAQVEQRLVNSWPGEYVVDISSTLLRTFCPPRFHAAKNLACAVAPLRKNITSEMTLSWISRNSAFAMGFSGSPPCKSAMTRIPSSSRSTSMSQLQRVDLRVAMRKLRYPPRTLWEDH